MALPDQLTDADLLARTRQGDAASYEELYRRHVADARRVAGLVSRSADEADEIVSEAFARVLGRLRGGGGPDRELTPYLRTVVRRLAIDRYRTAGRGGVADNPDIFDTIPDPDDPVELATRRDMVRKAYETLPSRWQQVLWRTEVEGQTPAAVAAELESTPNAVAALAYRAREGLRHAYLKMHVSASAQPGCEPFTTKITALVRGTLGHADQRAVNAHLGECQDCRARRDEMLILVSDMRASLVPALLGFVTTGGLVGAMGVTGAAATGVAGAVPGAGGAGQPAGLLARLRHFRPRGASVATGVTATAAATAVAVAMVTTMFGAPPDEPIADAPPVSVADTGADPLDGGTQPASSTEEPEPLDSEPDDETQISAVTEATVPVPESEPGPGSADSSGGEAQSRAGGSSPAPEDSEGSVPEAVPGTAPTRTAPPASAEPSEEPSPEPSEELSPEPIEEPTPDPPDEPSPEPPDTGDGGDEEPGPDARPRWCRAFPWWPGCPVEPERPIRDLVCAAMPEISFCPRD